VPFTSHRNLWNYAEPKPFYSAKPVCFAFSSFNFTVQDHILSTTGDAFSEGKKIYQPLKSLISFLNHLSKHLTHMNFNLKPQSKASLKKRRKKRL
jgi:hypothetical protein